jgi:hypothetical protein
MIWKHDHEISSGRVALETGHDLRDMLHRVLDLGVIKEVEYRAALSDNIQYIARLWINNLRFFSTGKLEKRWWRLGEIRPRRTLKKAVQTYYDACSSIVRRCEVILCQE